MRTAATAFVAVAAVASCASEVATIDDPALGHSMSSGVAAANAPAETILMSGSPMTAAVPANSEDNVHIAPAPSNDTVAGAFGNIDDEAADPMTIRIPSIQVDAPIIGLGLRDDGSIEVPRGTEETGWWRDGPEPGEPGPAVILGHVDSYTGPRRVLPSYRIADR